MNSLWVQFFVSEDFSMEFGALFDLVCSVGALFVSAIF